mmetsp:Transcript_32577/g.107446  ORF Transcript_32577/g.107446 Transcript_32577/m.107446 type:complete len:93 (+) Transcript_32577:2463-2741(+)
MPRMAKRTLALSCGGAFWGTCPPPPHAGEICRSDGCIVVAHPAEALDCYTHMHVGLRLARLVSFAHCKLLVGKPPLRGVQPPSEAPGFGGVV